VPPVTLAIEDFDFIRARAAELQQERATAEKETAKAAGCTCDWPIAADGTVTPTVAAGCPLHAPADGSAA
jgi:hypothetical protein